MKLYICADIEGSSGYSKFDEGFSSSIDYTYFRNQMTNEVKGACQGAFDGGVKEILVHDAHGSARNIIPSELPDKVKLMRGSVGDPYAMMGGLKDGGYDACFLTGFHSPVGSIGSPASHTFNRNTNGLWLNGTPLSEMMFDIYTASYLGVPTVFISGDVEICKQAKKLIPNIVAVPTVEGIGCGSVSTNPQTAIKEIIEGAKKAVSRDFSDCIVKLPKEFTIKMRFNHPTDALFNSYYPNVKMVDDMTLEYTTNDWYDLLTMVHFVLDK